MTDELIFSNGSYEIKIDEHWVFIKLDDRGEILDSFCDCEEDEDRCSHVKKAFEILKKDEIPLHVKFNNSFWKNLFFLIAKRYSFSKEYEIKEGGYLFKKDDKNFFLKTQNPDIKKFLKKDITKDVLSEDVSLKFSGMTFEEIQAYKEKKASDDVLFEMSFYSEIAKKIFLEKKYDIFLDLKKIKIFFDNTSITCDMDVLDWDFLISFLNTIKSPWKVFKYEDHIKNIFYKDENFKIDFDEELLNKIEKGANFFSKRWLFKPNWGFIEREKPLFLKKENNLLCLLENHRDLLEKFLKEKVHYFPKKAKYHLYFDEKNNLHILLYLFDKKDFLNEKSRFFGKWVYIENRGFFQIYDAFFKKHKKISSEDVDEFVNYNRIFLQNIKNFEIHSGVFHDELFYSITKDKNLKFFSKLKEKEGFFIREFKRWIYVEDKGFFEKKQGFMPFSSGTIINKNEVSRFILKNKKDLEAIKGFFLEKNPIKKIGLIVSLKDGSIFITPKIELNEGFLKDVLFFQNYIYLNGFYPILKKDNIPEEYRKEKKILSEENFIKYELDKIYLYIIYLDPKLRKPKDLKLKLKYISKRDKKYIAKLFYTSEIGTCNVKDLLEKEKYYFSNAGLLFLKDPKFQWLKDVEIEKDDIIISPSTWIKLSVFEDVGLLEASEESKKILKKLKSFETDEILDLSNLKANLWPYQEKGVKWLWFLYCYGLSGLLCDEMGLGKTLQSLALFSSVSKKKHLVVCPTSVIYHWEDLIGKFLKGFKVCKFHGVERKIEDFDILLTSYGIVRAENEKLSDIDFEVAIFDEIQIAKNKNSKTNKALKNIKAKMRLGLTGTPLENRLIELKALFDIVLPSFMPKEIVFKEYFIDPIEKENNSERKKLLTDLIKPFILRRKKKEVLLDLPEKVETIIHCDFSENQKELYYKIGYLQKENYLKRLKEESINYIHIFSLLSKLKQVCDHPVLINKDYENYYKYPSGKWDLLKELISEAIESDKKIVIFSQYLKMLDVMKMYLEKKHIKYSILTGSTVDRVKEIDKFKKDKDCRIFLASLFAAGLGIDLTCASVVIMYDRWWNPARENQAIDRVHRIGQNRGVSVYKLVTKNSIEEKIHQIIEKKKYLLEMVEGVDVEKVKFLSKELLSKEELIEVLEGISI